MVAGGRGSKGEHDALGRVKHDGLGRVFRRAVPSVLWVVGAAAGIAWLLGGCGGAPTAAETVGVGTMEVSLPSAPPQSSSSGAMGSSPARPAATTRAPAAEWLPAPDEIAGALRDASRDASGLRLYAPEEVPVGTRVASHWSDVLAASAPSGAAATTPNPRVSGKGATAEVALVLEVNGGRLAFMQNVHGDLGDLPGRPVGTVAGHLATAYRMLGADVVQWEDAGHWYAVIGTGLAANDVERFALSMRPL